MKDEIEEIIKVGKYKEGAQTAMVTIAIMLLGWLANNVDKVNSSLSVLNEKMVGVVVVSTQNKEKITQLESFANVMNREFVSRADFEEDRKNRQLMNIKIWDGINDIRVNLAEGKKHKDEK